MKIEAKHLSYSYDMKNFAVEDANAIVQDREFLAIVGHTGSGKSTFIQNLNGLLVPSAGEVDIDEFVIKNKIKLTNIKNIRKKIGIVFQFPEYQLFEENVEKDILFGPKNFGFDEKKMEGLASLVLKEVGLNDSFLSKSPFELSGGEKRRVAIAGILAFEPDVLIVDEPTAGLDPIASISMMDLFKKLNEEGKTIILVTHNMDHVIKYASRVIVFNKAHIRYDGDPLELFKDNELVRQLELDVPSVIDLKNRLAVKYPKLKDYTIKSIEDFVNAYKEVIHS